MSGVPLISSDRAAADSVTTSGGAPGAMDAGMTECVAVVIPTYNAASTIVDVITSIGPEVQLIIVVDDKCPGASHQVVADNVRDPRVVVLRHEVNQGVGGAVLTGIEEALRRNATIVVKLDSDGQMDPVLIPNLIRPIAYGQADYVKGNRFFFLSHASQMPAARLLGNLALSFMTKLSTGYWDVMDPTNGFVALQADVARQLPLERIARRYFFESDMLFHLGLLRAKVVDFPMRAKYADEVSNLRISRIFGPFLRGHIRNMMLRLLYKYFIRDFSVASVELVLGIVLFLFGLAFGTHVWIASAVTGSLATTGAIMLAAVPLLLGFQLLLAFLSYDIQTRPREPLFPLLRGTLPERRQHRAAPAGDPTS